MKVKQVSIATNPQYLASIRDLENVRAIQLAKDNNAVNGSGTVTPYGKVMGGAVLARDSAGNGHPCGLTEATDAGTGTNDIEVADVRNFRLGDKVSVISGSTPGKTFAAGGGGATLTLVPKVAGLSLAIVVSGTGTSFSAAYDETQKRITITSATNGGGTATTTLEDIIESLKTTFGALIASASASSGAAIAASTAATSLGPVQWTAVVTDREVTGIDTEDSTLTLSGGTFDVVIGDHVLKPDAYVPAGICDRTVLTVEYVDNELVVSEHIVSLRVGGDLRKDGSVVGANGDGLLRKALLGGLWPDPLNNGALRASGGLSGFRFLDL